MFNVNRLMTFVDDECIILHYNGKEIMTLSETWDVNAAFSFIADRINSGSFNTKHLEIIEVDILDVALSEEARPLLYSVQQFTQEEESAIMNENWKKLNELLLQRIEDGNIE